MITVILAVYMLRKSYITLRKGFEKCRSMSTYVEGIVYLYYTSNKPIITYELNGC